jgi:hypothetical protein
MFSSLTITHEKNATHHRCFAQMNELNQIDLMDDETHMDERLDAFVTEASLMTSAGDFSLNAR